LSDPKTETETSSPSFSTIGWLDVNTVNKEVDVLNVGDANIKKEEVDVLNVEAVRYANIKE